MYKISFIVDYNSLDKYYPNILFLHICVDCTYSVLREDISKWKAVYGKCNKVSIDTLAAVICPDMHITHCPHSTAQ